MRGGISDRLLLIAKQIDKGSSVADIGTDHAYLPIYLLENDIASHVIMTDVSEGSLAKATLNAGDYLQNTDTLEARLGDGLDVLEPGEVEVIVIAGMGGALIEEIMSWDITKARSFDQYLLQPRNNAGRLRMWLCHNGFQIEKNIIAKEGKHFAEIIIANTVSGEQTSLEEISAREAYIKGNEADILAQFDFPCDIGDDDGGITAGKYLRHELEKRKAILDRIRDHSHDPEHDSIYQEAILRRLEKLCNERNL